MPEVGKPQFWDTFFVENVWVCPLCGNMAARLLKCDRQSGRDSVPIGKYVHNQSGGSIHSDVE